MSVVATGIARIRHATTGVVYDINSNELEWYTDGSEERAMGPETTYSAQIDHPDLGELVWRVWEYPAGAFNDAETETGPHTLIENFRLDLGPSGPEGPEEEIEELEEANPRVEALIEWFAERYEDPAERTPYISAEGGYQYIYGGPYDAGEVLADNFPNENEAIIRAAVEAIEANGLTEWTRTPQPEDYGQDDDFDLEADDRISPVRRALRRVSDPGPGPVFQADEQGRFELQGWTPATEAVDTDLWDELRTATVALTEALAGTNAHTDLLDAANRYAAAFAGAELSIQRLYARGIGLENAARKTEELTADGELPPLPAGTQHRLRTMITLHATAVMTTAEGRSLVEAAAMYQRKPDTQTALDQSTKKLALAIEAATDAFGPAARQAVSEIVRTGEGPHPERSNQVGERLLGSLIATVGKTLQFTFGAVAGKILGDGLTATPLGLAAIAGVTGAAVAGWSFVIAHADVLSLFAAVTVQDLGWLTQLTNWLLAQRRNRA
jgi:hypothetical protein